MIIKNLYNLQKIVNTLFAQKKIIDFQLNSNIFNFNLQIIL